MTVANTVVFGLVCLMNFGIFLLFYFFFFGYNADLETQLNHHTQRYWIGYYIQKNKNKTLVAFANKPFANAVF